MASKIDIPLHEASVTIVKKSRDALCQVIDTKFRCVATIKGVDFEDESRTSHQRRPPATVSPEKRFEFRMRSGVKVSVWKADLTNFPTDAVVNAANEHLGHYGGLAQALSTAGGPQIQDESDEYVKKWGKLNTGDAVPLSAGSLQCKMIIHAVGPELPMNPYKSDVDKAKPLLKKTIYNILYIVDQHQLQNVAIPAISSGLFHFPLKECALTIVSSIKQYYDHLPYQSHRPKEIFLANHDEPTVQEMERACHQILGPQQHQSYSQAAARSTGSSTRSPPPAVQIGNVLLTLQKGQIEEQHTDVIVNTSSDDRNLNVGEISRAILNKAGSGIQYEMSTAPKTGHVICTKGHGLKCKEVYHTVCAGKGKDPAVWTAAKQLLYSSVFECLMRAANSQHKSISFPAIGTGNLGFLKEESASIMSQAVADFAERSQNKLEVSFVIFPSDKYTYQAFEKEIKALQEKVSHFMLATASGPIDDSHTSRASTPLITLQGPSVEATQEAKSWLCSRLFGCPEVVDIQNNFISHFSDQDHRQLSDLAEQGFFVEEFFSQGHACISVKSKTNAVIAVLRVEAMLCKIQKEFILEEEHQLKKLAGMDITLKEETVEQTSREFVDRFQHFRHLGLWVVKVDKVENCALRSMFDLKKTQLGCSSSEKMFQRIPAQFCEMISRIGFQAECAPPEDPAYGEGIYFTRNIKKALKMWKEKGEEYLYFVEAEVLTGKSTTGKAGLIMPPPVGKDPNVLYDSLDGGPDVSVIFSGYQALPKYIIICKKEATKV